MNLLGNLNFFRVYPDVYKDNLTVVLVKLKLTIFPQTNFCLNKKLFVKYISIYLQDSRLNNVNVTALVFLPFATLIGPSKPSKIIHVDTPINS